ncbi:hypothetical protein ABZP36_012707 [Zizania latifolia]
MAMRRASAPAPARPVVEVVLVVAVVLLGSCVGGGRAALLKAHFYRHSCPAAEVVVRDIVLARVAADPAVLPARLLRLFFHDCFVRALSNLPRPSDNFTALEVNFANKGLDVKDLVILSGAHTIGVGHCNNFGARLFNFTGAAAPSADPTLNAAYATQLRSTCGSPSNNATTVPMDPGSAARFDAHYFVNLKLGRGLFQSDAALLTDRRAAALVHSLTCQDYFLQEFKNAVRKMGRVGVLTGDQGEIRKNCRVVNGGD